MTVDFGNEVNTHFWSLCFPKSAVKQIWSIRQIFGLQKVGVAAVFLLLKVVSKFDFGHFLENEVTRSGCWLHSQNRQLKSNDSKNTEKLAEKFLIFLLHHGIISIFHRYIQACLKTKDPYRIWIEKVVSNKKV